MQRGIAALKKELRGRIASKAASLPLEYRLVANNQIKKNVYSLPEYKQADTIITFVSVEAEPDTRDIIEAALAEGKRVAVPRLLDNNDMEACIIKNLDELQAMRYSLYEPPAGTPVLNPNEAGLIMVPCLACDERGGRIGHGKGYYDRFLDRLNVPTACLCYSLLLQKKLPQMPHDHLMDIVISENGIIRTDENKK